ncbi:MAG: hypothetical protein QG593_401 [Patescibacteria group bacterium]|nr:hypothetical protein [Patescibacteria group bacterium]
MSSGLYLLTTSFIWYIIIIMKIFEVLPDSSKVRSVAAVVTMIMMPNAIGVNETPPPKEASAKINVAEFERTMDDLCDAVYFDSDGDRCNKTSAVESTPALQEPRNEPDMIKFTATMEEFGESLRIDQ